jgi:hypothetical protein
MSSASRLLWLRGQLPFTRLTAPWLSFSDSHVVPLSGMTASDAKRRYRLLLHNHKPDLCTISHHARALPDAGGQASGR